MRSQQEKIAAFAALHHRPGAFVIPNPWDVGSARLLAALGFEALATTRGGYANALGRMDGQVTLNEKLGHCHALCAATSLPINADLENCFRISLGSTLARAASSALLRAAHELSDGGSFGWLDGIAGVAEMGRLLVAGAAD